MAKENEKQAKSIDRRDLLKFAGLVGGAFAVAGVANIALGAGGGAAGAGGGGAGPGGFSNGWCSFWHDEQDPTYGSSSLNGPNPQGWDRTSAERQLDRLNKMVSLDYTGDPNAGFVALGNSPNTPSNELVDTYYNVAADALQKARDRASEQRGVTVEHARVIGVGIRYMITDWRPGTYGRDGLATATFDELFNKNEMWPNDMKSSSQNVSHGLQDQAGWGDASVIYGYTAPAYATNRDGEWQRAFDDMPGTWTLIVVAIAEAEPISNGKITIKKVLDGPSTNHDFRFHIKVTKPDGTTVIEEKDFTLKANQSVTYEYPNKSRYVVTEYPEPHFNLLTFDKSSGEIVGGEEVTATATNRENGWAKVIKTTSV